MYREKQKHIFFLIDSMEGGGGERQTLELLRGLDGEKYRKTLGMLQAQGSLLAEVPDEVSIVDLSDVASWYQGVQATVQLRRLALERKVDLMISSLTQSNCVLMRAAPFLPSCIPLVLTVQNNLSSNLERRYQAEWRQRLKTAEIRYLYRKADCIITVSKGVQSEVINYFGIAAHQTEVIHNLVNIERVRKKSRGDISDDWVMEAQQQGWPLLIAVGRLVEQKRFDELLDAFAILRATRSCRLVILGKGPLREELVLHARRLGIEKDVYMPGFVENPWAFIRRADLFVSSSHWEGFSLAHLESMACGTPLVLTDCDYGPRELVNDGVNGRLVPVGAPDKLARVVSELLDNPGEQQRLALTAEKYVERFDRSVIIPKYDQLFHKLIGRR